MNTLAAMMISYLLGSIPSAYIFGRVYKGIDIRDHGSGNVGATNTFRVLGKGPGTTVLILDILKGLIAVWLVGDLLRVASVLGRVLIGIAAVCGHNWTIFLEFKGGKGIATSLGVLIGLTIKFPSLIFALLICILTWVGTLFLWRYISVSSMAAALILPFAMVVTGQPPEMILLGAVFCVFVIYRHRSNITRLMIGTEHKVPLKGFGRQE